MVSALSRWSELMYCDSSRCSIDQLCFVFSTLLSCPAELTVLVYTLSVNSHTLSFLSCFSFLINFSFFSFLNLVLFCDTCHGWSRVTVLDTEQVFHRSLLSRAQALWPVVGQFLCISSQGTDRNWQEQALNNEICLKKFISQGSWKLEPKCIGGRSDEKIIEDWYSGESERLM